MNRKKKADLRIKIPNTEPSDKTPMIKPVPTPKIIIQSPSSNNLIPYFDEDVPEDYRVTNDTASKSIISDSSGLLGDEDLDAQIAPLPESDLLNRRNSNLRRNSISLPAGLNTLELEALRQKYVDHPANIPENRDGSDSTTYSAEHEGSLEGLNEILAEEKCAKIPLGKTRRKSVMATPARSPDGDSSGLDSTDDDSPVNSITSINSLASLLREKLQSIPSRIKKRPSDYRLKAFVSFLFLCIIFFVSFAYVMYHQQVLARAYFHKIKFSKTTRHIRVFNAEDVEILNGHLGAYFGKANTYRCMREEDPDVESLCFEWLTGARLYFDKKPSVVSENATDIQCYNIKWHALRPGVHPTDCFDWSSPQDHWYGGGMAANLSWPLGKSSQEFIPFITGDNNMKQWGNILKRYFISSKGVAILVDEKTPLHVAYNRNNDNKLCLQAKYDDFAYVYHPSKYPRLEYSICTSSNIKTLHSALSQQWLWDGLTEKDLQRIYSLIYEPVWYIAANSKEEFTEQLIYNYTQAIVDTGFLKQGHVIINEFWQNHIGDFTLNENKSETMHEIFDMISRRGFKITLTIQPFVSTESDNFAECTQKNLLITERHTKRKIPALTRYKSLSSAGVLDVTNNDTIPWLSKKLKKLVERYESMTFFLDYGVAYDMPMYYDCEDNLYNPDQYKTIFTNNFDNSLRLLGVSSAISLPKPPTFVSLPPFESTWTDIKKVIPTVLSYGIIGYPYLIPGAIGGDINLPVPSSLRQASNASVSNVDLTLPDRELYLRWLQLATFLPVMKFTHLPTKYGAEMLEMVKILINLREKTVVPLLHKFAKQALDTVSPLIRPLWMVEPGDPACYTVEDEFSVGDELIVAPVLEKGIIYREVYLPAGVWKDGIDGSLRKGSRWIHDYKVPTDKVAYFLKLPDNTRLNG